MSIVNLLEAVHEQLSYIYGNSFVVALLFLFLGIATFTDIKKMKIPDKLNGVFFLTRFALLPLIGFGWGNIGGAVIAFVSLMIPAMVKAHKMGGDIKCLTVMGLYLGLPLTIPFILLSCLYLAVYSFGGIPFGRPLRTLPFAPFFLLSHLTFTLLLLFM